MGLTLLAGSLLLLAVESMVEGTSVGIWLTGRFGLNHAMLAIWDSLRWSIAIVCAVLAVELLYHFGPNVKQRFRDQTTESVTSSTPKVAVPSLRYVEGRPWRIVSLAPCPVQYCQPARRAQSNSLL